MKKLFFSILTSILIFTATQPVQAKSVVTPIGIGIGTLAVVGAAGTAAYSTFSSLLALYYSTFRKEVTREDELFNNKECRQNHRAAFLSRLTTLGLGVVAFLAFGAAAAAN